jgi:hypothetical protein
MMIGRAVAISWPFGLPFDNGEPRQIVIAATLTLAGDIARDLSW